MKIFNSGSRSITVKGPASGDPVFELGSHQMAEVSDTRWEALKKVNPYKLLLERGVLQEKGSATHIVPGDGDPDCKDCLGRGFILEDNYSGHRCRCVLKRDVILNVQKIWPGANLIQSPVLPDSKLKKFVLSNLWVTAEDRVFKAHLRHAAVRQGPSWMCRVRSDAEMMAAWLASAKAKSIEIFDADVRETVVHDMDLADLAEPPDLLVMWLGVKRARNAATPEALMEVIMMREFLGKPTWILDQPSYRVDEESHRCFSSEVLTHLSGWPRLQLSNDGGSVSSGGMTGLPGVEDISRPEVSLKKSSKAGPARVRMSSATGFTKADTNGKGGE